MATATWLGTAVTGGNITPSGNGNYSGGGGTAGDPLSTDNVLFTGAYTNGTTAPNSGTVACANCTFSVTTGIAAGTYTVNASGTISISPGSKNGKISTCTLNAANITLSGTTTSFTTGGNPIITATSTLTFSAANGIGTFYCHTLSTTSSALITFMTGNPSLTWVTPTITITPTAEICFGTWNGPLIISDTSGPSSIGSTAVFGGSVSITAPTNRIEVNDAIFNGPVSTIGKFVVLGWIALPTFNSTLATDGLQGLGQLTFGGGGSIIAPQAAQQALDAAILTAATLNTNDTDTTVAFGASNGTAKSKAVYDAAISAAVFPSASFVATVALGGPSAWGPGGTGYGPGTFSSVIVVEEG